MLGKLSQVLILTILPDPAVLIGEVLRFPTTPSASNYVILPAPNFESLTTSISICAWVKPRHTGISYSVWLSYNVASSADDEIVISSFGSYDDLFNQNFGTSASYLEKDVWSHYCSTWQLATRVKTIYVNGVSKKTGTTTSGRTLKVGGTLVLGQRQGSKGGSFSSSYSFGGDLYELNIFDKVLSAEEVTDMYNKGRCGSLDPSLFENVALQWTDFMDAQRSGGVVVRRGTCSQWNLVRIIFGWEDGILSECLNYNCNRFSYSTYTKKCLAILSIF